MNPNELTEQQTVERIRQLKRGVPITSLTEAEAQYLEAEANDRNTKDNVRYQMVAQIREDGWKVVKVVDDDG